MSMVKKKKKEDAIFLTEHVHKKLRKTIFRLNSSVSKKYES